MNRRCALLYAFVATMILLCSHYFVFAQQTDTMIMKEPPVTYPQFPGGLIALQKFIRNNIRAENLGADSETSFYTGIKFIINEDGSISDIKPLKYPEASIMKELMRITASMPKWKPATENGKPIKMNMKLPFTYRPQY